MLCFKLYESRDPSIHNTAGVAIRQIVSAMFERLNNFMNEEKEEEGGDGDVGTGGGKDGGETHKQLPTQARDAYLLFQVSRGNTSRQRLLCELSIQSVLSQCIPGYSLYTKPWRGAAV